MSMYGSKAYELTKELERTRGVNLPPFDENGMRQIFDEMKALHEQNQSDMDLTATGTTGLVFGVKFRHAALERNKQCVLAYVHNRLMRIRDIRWAHGSVLPEAVRLNTTEQEQHFFKNYNRIIASYMRSLGDDSDLGGIDLTRDVKPPKNLMVRIRVLQDWEIEDDESGDTVLLKKDSLQCLEMSQCEALVRQGVFEII